jgi:hypothetical protein
MRIVKLAHFIIAAFTAIALGIATGHAQDLEQVKPVFEHAIPNIAGKPVFYLVCRNFSDWVRPGR